MISANSEFSQNVPATGTYSVVIGGLLKNSEAEEFYEVRACNRSTNPDTDPDGDNYHGDCDNCPAVSNEEQIDQDYDSDGDDCDPDKDGDGVTDVDELALADPTDPLDPDTDDDGIIDGLDRSGTSSANNLCLGHGEDAAFGVNVTGQFTCAATETISTFVPAQVDSGGDLLFIAPAITLANFSVAQGAKFQVINTDPTAINQ